MQLNDEQRRILAGAEGPFLATCIRWLVEWGDAMDLLRSACRHRVRCHSTAHITFAHEEQYDEIDTVILGCPHDSLNEIAQITGYLEGKHIADGVTLWVCTAYSTGAAAQRLGHARAISQAGGYLFCDSCPTNSMRVRAKRIVTAGFKQAHYARGMIGAEVIVDHLQGCLDAALTGRWHDEQ